MSFFIECRLSLCVVCCLSFVGSPGGPGRQFGPGGFQKIKGIKKVLSLLLTTFSKFVIFSQSFDFPPNNYNFLLHDLELEF